MSESVTIDQLSATITKQLTEYNEAVAKGTKQEAKKSMQQLVRQTKATAPRKRPKYYKAISSKAEFENASGVTYVWYVKGSEYRLSHLLEYGHAKRNGGRTKAYHFIQAATDPILASYTAAVERILQNG